MIATLTGTGLSAAAGLNAYIPVLIVALVARFTDVVTLPAEYSWITSWWAIGIVAVLLAVEVVVDKVPAVDTVNDAIQTVVRPLSGGLSFAAIQGAQDLDQSTWMREHSWVGVLLGVVVALVVHTGKVAARPVANVGTGGVAAPVLSTAEDVTAVGLVVAALFAPVLVAVALVVLLGATVWAWSRFARLRRTRRARAAASPGGGAGTGSGARGRWGSRGVPES